LGGLPLTAAPGAKRGLRIRYYRKDLNQGCNKLCIQMRVKKIMEHRPLKK